MNGFDRAFFIGIATVTLVLSLPVILMLYIFGAIVLAAIRGV